MLNKGDIAEIVHNTHCVYCHHIGDMTQVLWKDAPDWQKMSTLFGVREVMDNPDITPEQLHQKWMDARLEAGWTYGGIKDVERKQHPCLVEYNKLDGNQKQKDYMFRAVVLACMGVNDRG